MNDPQIQHLKERSALLSAVADAGNGKAGALAVHNAASEAWQGGLLTDAEMNGIGKALLALERAAP